MVSYYFCEHDFQLEGVTYVGGHLNRPLSRPRHPDRFLPSLAAVDEPLEGFLGIAAGDRFPEGP